MCSEGRLYDVERWISQGNPLQLAPNAIQREKRLRSALQIAVQSGQHSLTYLLLSSGYSIAKDSSTPLDSALGLRRWDLVDLLIAWGADVRSADTFTVLNTYNSELYERFWLAGCDFTEYHTLGMYLGETPSNRPLLGFVKRHSPGEPKIQGELNIALGCHVREENEKGVSLCLWAGANPHTYAPDPRFGLPEEDDLEDDEQSGWTAMEEAAKTGNLGILKRLHPDPDQDNFDNLYRYASSGSVVHYLLSMQPPLDLTSIYSWHFMPWPGRGPSWGAETILESGVQWAEADAERLAGIRRSLLKFDDYDIRRIFSHLKKPAVCDPDTFAELTRTSRMQQRLISLGIIRKPISVRERRRNEVERLMNRYDRETLYAEVWKNPVQKVAKAYGISGVALGKACRKLRIPVPPRGYWARVRAGQSVRKPALPKLR